MTKMDEIGVCYNAIFYEGNWDTVREDSGPELYP
jgi:hypothetical protein